MGRKKYIETPDKMRELFDEYKEHTKSNPRKENFYNAKEGKEVSISRETPLTMVGFENYVFNQKLNSELSHYFSNKDDRYSEYVAICSYIQREIRQDQIEGGMVGIYNPSITQRLNNLVDKQDLTSKGDKLSNAIEVEIVRNKK